MKKLAFIAVLAIGIMGSYSCYGDPGPGTAKVIVVDTADYKVPFATVTLSQSGQNSNGFIWDQGMTNFEGEYTYTHQDFQVDFGTEVILDVVATEGGRTGYGIV